MAAEGQCCDIRQRELQTKKGVTPCLARRAARAAPARRQDAAPARAERRTRALHNGREQGVRGKWALTETLTLRNMGYDELSTSFPLKMLETFGLTRYD